jgi:hypothetical protein
MFHGCRPAGRLFYWLLVVAVTVTNSVSAVRGEDSAAKPGKAASSSAGKGRSGEPLPRAGSPAPQSGPTLTSVVDTVYMADGTPAQGVLIISWPAFVTASGTSVAPGDLQVTLGTNGALNVALAPNAGNKPGPEKKDAALSFLQNALAMTDAVASRDIVDPEQFKDGISQIIDGTVECLNASTWSKKQPNPDNQPSA